MRMEALRKVSFEEGQESAIHLWNQARETGEDFLYQLNRQVRRNPWKAVAIAAAAGLIAGALLSRPLRG
jgi:ElaB/YqjD/DUF883 family membrane-anchored ribosome-binding protein